VVADALAPQVASKTAVVVVMMLRVKFIVHLLLAMLCMGCRDGSSMKHQAHFLALGDSYTIGESVAEPQRWPVQLAAMLRDEGVAIDDPCIIARTGWTSDELSAAIAAQPSPKSQAPWQLVSLLIGVNNQYRGRSVEEFRTQFTQLLHRAADFAGGNANRVIVLSIPDWGATPFGQSSDRDAGDISKQIESYNNVVREESLRAGAHFIDITPISLAAKTDPAMVAGDGLHPSGKMYSEWARLTLPVARQILHISNP
jgi:lysophospholipase L1-like esterase